MPVRPPACFHWTPPCCLSCPCPALPCRALHCPLAVRRFPLLLHPGASPSCSCFAFTISNQTRWMDGSKTERQTKRKMVGIFALTGRNKKNHPPPLPSPPP